MLLIYGEEGAWSESEREACYRESAGLAHQLKDSGHYISASPLQSAGTAVSVRNQGGKQIVIDGPFAETREQLGGFFMIEAKDRDEAVAIAQRLPGGRKGTVEIRPVLEVPDLPAA